MRTLEHLQEDEQGKLFRENGEPFPNFLAFKVSRMKTLTVKIPCEIQEVIDNLIKENSAFIPKDANAFTASNYDYDTSYFSDEKQYTFANDDQSLIIFSVEKHREQHAVFAFQFYQLLIYKSE
ncbi:MAG TPA: hypothetical protein HA283_01155 [Nanoarchaeota archaeon]|nr:hypothetical protein [Nanoarchaeota archaeon]HIH62880.1 hypothetical protein [Nanoarchaeota archaeon]HIJ10297.1 hypothetical protein [Nanoarchaeota archaeon]